MKTFTKNNSKFLRTLFFILLTTPAFTFAQDQSRPLKLLIGGGFGVTNYKEFYGSLETGIMQENATIYPAFTMDAYVSNQDANRHWTVLDLGARMYVNVKKKDWGFVQMFADCRYATMGREHKGQPTNELDLLGGYNNIYPSFGAAITTWVPDFGDDGELKKNGFFKLSASYGTGQAGRFKIGIAIIGVL